MVNANDPASDAHATDVRDDLAYDRTHLANERTFAAWLRTGIAVAAGGIAVAHLVPEPSRDSLIALALGASFVLLGLAILAYGAHEFSQVNQRLAREGGRKPMVSARSVNWLTGVVSALLLAVLVFLWTHQGRVFRQPDAPAPTPSTAP